MLPPVLAGLSALLYILCFPKANLGDLGWIAFVPLLSTLSFDSYGRSFRRAFGAGLLANLGTLYWIYPTCRAAQVSIPVSALSVTALSAYMALYWGAFGLWVRFIDHRPGWERPFFLAAGWTALEFVRSHFLTGFPWLLLAYSQWKRTQHIPLAELGGPYMVSFLLMLFNATAALLARDILQKRWDWVRRVSPGILGIVALTAWNASLWRRPLRPAGPPLSLALVQGNIDQYKKWDEQYEQEVVDVYTRLTSEAATGRPDLIVWPETAVPGWIPNEPKYVDWLQDLAQQSQTFLLAGAASRQGTADYNAAFLLSPGGEIVGQYRKRHLVPFGEVIPFQTVLSRLVRVLGELGEMSASDDWTVFKVPQGSFSVNICFESLFPDLVRKFVRQGAQLSVNITNDGWFLDTAGPEQHFIAGIFRAVETRTWWVMATNTGISGFVDPRGKVAARTSINERTVLKGNPQPMAERTFYTRYGNVFAWGCVAFVLLGAAFVFWDRKKRYLF